VTDSRQGAADPEPDDDSAAARRALAAAAVVQSARTGSGIATVYEALDHLVHLYALDDAALVLDVPELGRQVLRAGRRPIGNDEHGLLRAEPGLYLDPPRDDPALAELLLAMAALGLRLDLSAGRAA
jgi:hypothetical protein